MRVFISAVLATTLIASSALAGDVGALAPGKPAGVKQAQMSQTEMFWALGLTAAAAGIVIAATQQNHTRAAAPTTTVAPTTTTP
jgi:dipeptide/tripeptide permease